MILFNSTPPVSLFDVIVCQVFVCYSSANIIIRYLSQTDLDASESSAKHQSLIFFHYQAKGCVDLTMAGLFHRVEVFNPSQLCLSDYSLISWKSKTRAGCGGQQFLSNCYPFWSTSTTDHGVQHHGVSADSTDLKPLQMFYCTSMCNHNIIIRYLSQTDLDASESSAKHQSLIFFHYQAKGCVDLTMAGLFHRVEVFNPSRALSAPLARDQPWVNVEAHCSASSTAWDAA